MTHMFDPVSRSAIVAGLLVALLAGCTPTGTRVQRIDYSPYPQNKTLAVAPFLNQSGSATLEMDTVTEAFYSELQQIKGLQVVPPARVRAAMRALDITAVSSPSETLALAGVLSVDGVIAGSVTQHDPYFPPHMEMLVQLYEYKDKLSVEQTQQEQDGLDPLLIARQGKPFAMTQTEMIRPRATVVRLIDSDTDDVIDRLKTYAVNRAGKARSMGWRYYTTSRNYLGFVSHEIIGELLELEQRRLFDESNPDRDDMKDQPAVEQ